MGSFVTTNIDRHPWTLNGSQLGLIVTAWHDTRWTDLHWRVLGVVEHQQPPCTVGPSAPTVLMHLLAFALRMVVVGVSVWLHVVVFAEQAHQGAAYGRILKHTSDFGYPRQEVVAGVALPVKHFVRSGE